MFLDSVIPSRLPTPAKASSSAECYAGIEASYPPLTSQLCRLCQDKGILAATANALMLHKCLKQRMWDSSGVEVRQLPGIGRLLGDRLAGAGMGTLRQLEAADPRRIEAITQRHFPFGVATMPGSCAH